MLVQFLDYTCWWSRKLLLLIPFHNIDKMLPLNLPGYQRMPNLNGDGPLVILVVPTYVGYSRFLPSMVFYMLREILARSIPHLFEGTHLMGAAKTGSWKTLAFLIPAIELLCNLHFLPRNRTGVLSCPTMELAIQIPNVFMELMKYYSQTLGYAVVGNGRRNVADQSVGPSA